MFGQKSKLDKIIKICKTEVSNYEKIMKNYEQNKKILSDDDKLELDIIDHKMVLVIKILDIIE